LLGSHVAGLALDESTRRARRARLRFRDAEIDQLDRSIESQDEVRWRDVAVNDPERRTVDVEPLVRVVQARRGGTDDRQPQIEREPHAPRGRGLEDRAHRLAVDVLHRQEVRAIVRASELEHLSDVLVVQRSDEASLVEKHRHVLGVVAACRRQRLEDDVAREPTRAGCSGEVHARHPTRREMTDQLVPTERVRPHARHRHRLERPAGQA
jgi:hypothetical protein